MQTTLMLLNAEQSQTSRTAPPEGSSGSKTAKYPLNHELEDDPATGERDLEPRGAGSPLPSHQTPDRIPSAGLLPHLEAGQRGGAIPGAGLLPAHPPIQSQDLLAGGRAAGEEMHD